jgi:histidinol phosphatase-like enzyme
MKPNVCHGKIENTMPDKKGFEEAAKAIISSVSEYIKWRITPSVCDKCKQTIAYHYDLVIVEISDDVPTQALNTVVDILKNVAREIYEVDVEVVLKIEGCSK